MIIEKISKVLVIDDNPADIWIISDVLTKKGFTIFGINSGQEAINKINSIAPDLILLDVRMPEMDGFETCQLIKEKKNSQNIPIIFMTCIDNTQDKIRGFQLGAVDYITKPFQEEEVIARIMLHIKLHRLTQKVEAQASSLELQNQELEKVNQELEKVNQELEKIVNLDGLTSIANRRRFDEYLHQEWKRLSREKNPLSLILCDIDYFKKYNDYYGHLEGDHCLQKVALTLQNSVMRPADLVSRYGGEEFGVILPNTDSQGVIHVMQRIQREIDKLKIPHLESIISPYVTLSLGAGTIMPNATLSSDCLILAADHKLYEAKEQGRNCYCY